MNLRILLLMDPFIPVPPVHYGGIERVIADLAAEYHRRGHEVHLWAGPGSNTPGIVEPFGQEGEWTRWSNLRNITALTLKLWRRAGQFDVIHNFGRLAYLTGILRSPVPKIQTYMRRVNPDNMRRVRRLGGRSVHFTAVSDAIRQTGLSGGGEWSVIYNCAPISKYQCNLTLDPRSAPLAFLGRLERCKGAHNAIEAARQLQRPLRIAGNISTLAEERRYFEEVIAPNIDGNLVSYIGPVDDQQKNELLASSAALLIPVEWEEPFPVVLPEALACGTPVIGYRRGGIPEGISHGTTGFLCDTMKDLVECIDRLPMISRAACRGEAENRFSDRVIADQYEALYCRLMTH